MAHVQILYIKLGENLHLNIGKDAFTRKNLLAKWIAFESMQTTGLASQAEDRDFYDYAEFMGNCENLLIKVYEDWNEKNRENILILLCYLKVLIQSNTGLYLKAYHICIGLLNKNIHSRDRVALYAMLCQIQRLDKIENSQNSQQRNFSNSLWTAYRAEQIYQDLTFYRQNISTILIYLDFLSYFPLLFPSRSKLWTHYSPLKFHRKNDLEN